LNIRDKLIKNSTVKDTATLAQSKVYGKKDMVPTNVPMINVALGGSIDGGLTPGLTMLAGPSKHFKTGFSLLMAKAYLNKYPDGAVLFYDSEFGTPQEYFDQFGIPQECVIHTPISDVEQLKFDVMKQLNELERGEKVIIIVDSVGNLASKKEVEDALNEKAVADMSRAKQLKSLFRMVTPHLSLKDIPMVVVNHTYKELGMYPKDIVSGGTGGYYSSDNIWVLGRQQDKDGQDINGYHFIINIEKSRYVKEKSKIPISVSWEGGINTWSGLLENALEHGSVTKPKNGWYQKEGDEKMYREKQLIRDGSFWKDIFKTTNFADFLKKKYKIAGSPGSIYADAEEFLEKVYTDDESESV